MDIRVAVRFRPFSRLPGAACLVPGERRVRQLWPAKSVVKSFSGEVLEEGEGGRVLFQELEKPFRGERLSFGVAKSQDVDLIRRRGDLKEILPLWYKLGTYYSYASGETVGSGSLLYELMHETDPHKLEALLLSLYYAGFSPFFVPRSEDSEHHGFKLPPLAGENPLLLLTEGTAAIRRMIVEEREGTIFVLPHLPPLFSAGRLIEAPLSQGTISIEWTKYFIRRVICKGVGEEARLRFPKEVKSYRVKSLGKTLYFDNFMA